MSKIQSQLILKRSTSSDNNTPKHRKELLYEFLNKHNEDVNTMSNNDIFIMANITGMPRSTFNRLIALYRKSQPSSLDTLHSLNSEKSICNPSAEAH